MDCRRYCLPQISQVKTSQYTAGTAAPHPYHISVVRSKFGVNVELGCVRFASGSRVLEYCTARCHACMPSHAILGSRAVPRVRCDGCHGVADTDYKNYKYRLSHGPQKRRAGHSAFLHPATRLVAEAGTTRCLELEDSLELGRGASRLETAPETAPRNMSSSATRSIGTDLDSS